MTAEAVDSLDQVPAIDWDRLAAGRSFYLSHAWLRSLEDDRGARARYLLVWSGSRLAGALPVYRVVRESNPFYDPGRLVDGRWSGEPYVLAGSRRAYVNDLLVDQDRAPLERRRVLGSLLERLRAEVADAGAARALFLYVSTGAAGALAAAGCAEPVLTAADAGIDLQGTGIADYLARFPSKRRRQFIREMARFEAAGYELREERLADCWEQAGELLANVERKYGRPSDPAHWKQITRRQGERLNDRGVVFACRRGAALVAFCLAYPWGGCLHERMIGFDYDSLENACEYFNMAFYVPLAHAYAAGLRKVHLGRESYAAKVFRGARLSPLWSLELDHDRGSRDWNGRLAEQWRRELRGRGDTFDDRGWHLWGSGAG